MVHMSKRVTTGCPFCSRKRLAGIAETWSSQYPESLAYWDKSKKDGVKPFEIGPGSHYMAWWRCIRNKGHVWLKAVRDAVKSWRKWRIVRTECQVPSERTRVRP
jgi:hypothetical protein